MAKTEILKYIIVGCAVMVAVFLAATSIRIMNRERTANQSQQGQASEMNSLTLKDYPKLFSENVIIVVGESATEVENESAVMIEENLKELTGNEPISKNDIELSELDKKACSLILVGTPTTNSVLQEVYGKEYPGEKKAVLEILRNPWNCDKGLLIVAGSDEYGVKAMSKILTDSKEVRGLSDKIIQFKEFEIGDKIVYFHQRMIDEAVVEGDYITYQFDKDTKALLNKKTHWRADLPEHLPPMIITKEEAELMVKGKVQFTRLYIISPESDVFLIKPTPKNPCWVVRSIDNNNISVTIIDAVGRKILGYGVPPPYKGFSLSGPQDSDPCSGVWTSWYQNAASWFNAMGYPTEAVAWPGYAKVRSHIQSTETAMFYAVAHGHSSSFDNSCTDSTTGDEIHDWLKNYTKMPFAFIAGCNSMSSLGRGTLSYEFRKGSTEDTVTVGYVAMETEECNDAWVNSVRWQTAMFNYMSQGNTVKHAFDMAIADYPMCVGCVRFAGDENFAVVPVVGRVGPDQITLTVYPNPAETGVTIEGLTEKVTICIFTLSGELVRKVELAFQDSWYWDLKNEQGEGVTPGGYLCVVTNAAGEIRRARIVIL